MTSTETPTQANYVGYSAADMNGRWHVIIMTCAAATLLLLPSDGYFPSDLSLSHFSRLRHYLRATVRLSQHDLVMTSS